MLTTTLFLLVLTTIGRAGKALEHAGTTTGDGSNRWPGAPAAVDIVADSMFGSPSSSSSSAIAATSATSSSDHSLFARYNISDAPVSPSAQSTLSDTTATTTTTTAGPFLRPTPPPRNLWPRVGSVFEEDMFDSRTGLLRGAIQKELSSSAFRVRYLEASLLVPGVPWASGANLDPGTVEDGQRMTDAKTGNVDAVLEGGPYAVLVLGPAGSTKWDVALRELPRVMADNRWPTATAFHVVSSALVRQLSPNWHELTNLARKRGLRGLSDLWDGFFREPAKRFRGDLLTGLLGTQRNVVLFDTAAADLASPGAGMAKGTTKAMIERLSKSGYEVVVMSVYASEQQCEKRAHAAIRSLASNPSPTKSTTPLPLPQDHDRLERERERDRAARPPAASANTIEGVEGRPYNGRTWPLAVLGIVDVVNWCRREWPNEWRESGRGARCSTSSTWNAVPPAPWAPAMDCTLSTR